MGGLTDVWTYGRMVDDVIAKTKSSRIDGLPYFFKDGAYYFYCAYVLRISRYSGFLSVMLTNAGIFLRGLKLSRESRSE